MDEDNKFVYEDRWSERDASSLAERLERYMDHMGVQCTALIEGLQSDDRIPIMMMFFMLGLEYKGMVAKASSDIQIMEKGARKLFRAMSSRAHAAKWDNDHNIYLSAKYYVCIDPGLVHLQGNVHLDSTMVNIWNKYLIQCFYTQVDTGNTYVMHCTSICDMNGEPTKYHWVSVRCSKNGSLLRSAIKTLVDRGYIMP